MTSPTADDNDFLVVASNPHNVTWSTSQYDNTDLLVLGASDLLADAIRKSGIEERPQDVDTEEDFQPDYSGSDDSVQVLKEEIEDLKRNGQRLLENEALMVKNTKLQQANDTLGQEMAGVVRRNKAIQEEVMRIRAMQEVVP